MATNRQTFVMSDERVNSYGFRVLTAGIDTSDFEANAVGYWGHRFSDLYTEGALLPMFRWENLRKDGGRLLGDLVADEQDEEAMKIMGKIERGFINACSITFQATAYSDATEDLVTGQTRATVTKCQLLECSPVGIPGNGGALKLRNSAGETISLSANSDNTGLDALLPTLSLNQHTGTMKLTAITLAAAFGMMKPDEATEDTVLQEASRLQRDNSDKDTKIATLNAEIKKLGEGRVKSLVNDAVSSGRITEDQRAAYESLAAADYDNTAAVLAHKLVATTPAPAPQSLSQMLAARGAGTGAAIPGAADAECEFDKLSRSNPNELARIRSSEPTRFELMRQEKMKTLDSRALVNK